LAISMQRRHILTGALVLMTTARHPPAAADALEDTLWIDLSTGGRAVVRLRPDLAPNHVERIKELARAGFYDGIVFHRVIPGFMAQTGDPTGTGRGGSDRGNLRAEFSRTPFARGTIGMARTQDPNSANSQFFIAFAAAPWLDGQYTVWGEVIEGMEWVDKIAVGEPPANPDRMVKVRVAADGG
jgi:peptidylprolyl isomerase